MDKIEVGLVAEMTVVVDESMCTAHLGAEVGPVLATPAVCNLFEQTCLQRADPLLPEGYGTVGTALLVKHYAPTPIGFSLHIKGELVEIDGPRQTWNLEAFDDLQKVAEGTNWRSVVNTEKMKGRLLDKEAQIRK